MKFISVVILFVITNFFLILVFFKWLRNKKTLVITRFFFPEKREIMLQNILYIFLLGAILKKNIQVYLFRDDNFPFDTSEFCHIKALCSKKNIQFFLHNNFSYLVFFINEIGTIEYIFNSQKDFFKDEIELKDKIKITHDSLTNLFDIETAEICFKKNTMKNTILILLEIFSQKNN